jgi:hypothetical protein
MKSPSLAIMFVLVGFTIQGCGSGTRPSAPGPPVSSSSASPAEISSSDQVVKAYCHLVPSSSTPGTLELVISPGFHINANPATFPYLIATEVQPGQVDGVMVNDKIVYPPGVLKKFPFAEEPLAVYEDRVIIPIPFKITKPATNNRLLPLKVRVQACDNEKCFPPATLEAALPVDVNVRY